MRYDVPFSASAIKWSHNNYIDTGSSNWFELDGDVLSFADWKSQVDPAATSHVAAYVNADATQATYDAAHGGGGSRLISCWMKEGNPPRHGGLPFSPAR